MKYFVKKIRETELILGDDKKICQDEEKEMRKIARKKIISSKPIKKGSKFTLENLTFKRSAFGIECSNLEHLLTKNSKSDILSNTPIKLEDY